MRKFLYIFLVAFSMSLVLPSCRDQKNDSVEDVADDVGDAAEDAADDVEDAVEDITDDN
ncbi:hypothetical protein SAMN04487989_103140 [Bizionia echini]|uniref:Uncharacterized protein n=1 Tax=Bizionia echini TaxID=649333 RepID=A0A1I5BHJ4_9FLAO|nr:hypothetical protein [Bizionia echini]SFN74193.1 hypothetical protein SAMN04487989_103140 [Bizionia echini]